MLALRFLPQKFLANTVIAKPISTRDRQHDPILLAGCQLPPSTYEDAACSKVADVAELHNYDCFRPSTLR